MDFDKARKRLSGCYVTVPTLFHDDAELSLNLEGIRRHVDFLLGGGLKSGNAVFLAGGAAGDFSTMTFEERVVVAKTVVEAVEGRAPVAMGAQTTSTAELRRLARAARDLGADYIQVSCPFYFGHSEEDFYEYVVAAAEAADVGIIVYNTFWTSTGVSLGLVGRLAEIPNVVGLKWATPHPNWMSFEQVVQAYGRRFSVIDNQMHFVASHMLGARGFEVHVCNYWPEWGARLIEQMKRKDYPEVQDMLTRAAQPFMKLWSQIEQEYTSGDGYLDKLVHGVGRPAFQPLPPSHPGRPRALPGGRPSHAPSGGSAQGHGVRLNTCGQVSADRSRGQFPLQKPLTNRTC